VLRLFAFIVPASHRGDWLREWEAELAWLTQTTLKGRTTATQTTLKGRTTPGRARIARRLCGALVHALWLRKEEWSLDMLLQDLRYALRVLAGRPSFALVAALTLALGIGANTAIFSVVYGVLLKPLSLRDPDRLVQLWETNPLRNWTNATAAPANLLDWKKRNRVFEDIGYYPGQDDKTPFENDLSMMSLHGEPEPVTGLQVSANLFPVLGVAPSFGRTFRAEEQVPGRQRVAILSHDLWRTRFNGDPSVLGRSIPINLRDYEVVGVMPAGFQFPMPDIQLWTPFAESDTFPSQRRPHYLRAIARLKPGVTLEQARAHMTGIAAQLEKEYPDTNTQMGVGLGPLHDWVVADVRTALLVFISAVGLVLLIACANVANLLLARAAGRAREFAVRTALGAARLRLVRQLLTESLLLALAGGLLGIVVANWTLGVLIRLSPEDLPRLREVRIDGWVFAFMALVTGATAFLFGLVPAWHSSRTDAAALKDGARTTSGGGRTTRRLLVIGQVAASVALVACAGLLLRSFERLQRVPPGVDPANVITFRLNLPGVKYDADDKAIAFYEALMERLRALPGVTAAGGTSVLPLEGSGWTGDLFIEGRPEVWGRELRHKTITPGYFAAIGLRIVRGRDFAPSDTASAPAVAIVNETLVRMYFQDTDPIGRRITFDNPRRRKEPPSWSTIVGVVADEKQDSLSEAVAPEAYDSHRQGAEYGQAIAVRSRIPPAALLPEVRKTVRELEPAVALYDVRTLEDVVARSMSRERFTTWLVAVFAALALAIATVGVYGVVAFSVSRRTQEIGVRVALGASRGAIVRIVMAEALGLVGIGLALGLAAAIAAGRGIRTLLFETAPTDAVTLASVVGLLAVTAILAGLGPTRRALSVDPIQALRYE
jgi:putative ABC transport system permease protein